MKFTCEKALLVSAISVAGRTVAPKSAIPCLEGILLRAGLGVQLTGFNLETGITVDVAADVREEGVCVMPARLFFDIVRKLPDDMVTVSVDPELQDLQGPADEPEAFRLRPYELGSVWKLNVTDL